MNFVTLRRACLALLFVACSDSTTTAPTLANLDRPTDVAFACYGGMRVTNGGAASADQAIVQTAQPIQACDIRSQPHADGVAAPVPPGQEQLSATSDPGSSSYYAFVLQSAPGTIALASWPTVAPLKLAVGDVRVLDADPLAPGKNAITVGEDPIAIATDRVGCYELTANAGTCDLSVVDINSALNYATNVAAAVGNGQGVEVHRLDVVNSSGVPVRAKPAAMVAEPSAGTIGTTCPAQPTGLVYVAYPNCHLVAGIDTATGKIVTGVQYDDQGVASIVNGDVVCPDECGVDGNIGMGRRPVALDLKLDPNSGRRVLAIGSQNSSVVTIAELGIDSRPTSLSSVILEDPTGKLGVTDVAVSPVIGMGGTQGFINDTSALGGNAQFLYAVATDNTVRVANIFEVANKECDTQVDPRNLHDVKNVKTLSCMAVGDPATPSRRPGAKGPGIALPGDAVPTSVDIFKVDTVDGDTRLPGTPARMIGYFGVITASTGSTYVVNIDDDDFADFVDDKNPVATPIPLDIAHQLRDGLPNRGALAETTVDGNTVPSCNTDGPDPDATTGNSGGPRIVGAPTRKLPAGTLATEKVGALPSIRQVQCTGSDSNRVVSELAFAAPVDIRDRVFPDLRGLRNDEVWTLTWEGPVSTDTSATAVDGPVVRTSQMVVDAAGFRLVDQARPYCDAGIQPYDIVQLRGCDPALGDVECPLGYSCFVHPNSQVAGLGACILTHEADRLANACKSFLTSMRRYTVGASSSGTLQLLPRKHVLRTTPVDGCTSDQQCQMLADYALKTASAAHPFTDTTAPDSHRYTCAVDTQRAPDLDASEMMPMKRCIQTCNTDTDCDPGTVCVSGTCMEGVIPPQACVNAPQRYELRVGEAFAVVGSRSGFDHPIVADPQGKCVVDPSASRLLTARLPLRAPACDPTADPRTGKRMDGTYEPNPCSLTVDEVENQPNYLDGTCTLGSPAASVATRSAEAIRFRNRGLSLTMVDPTYPGDVKCIGDRQGTLGNVPVVAPGVQTSVRITAGFDPFVIGIRPALPVKVRRGPGESIWVVDEGDVLSTATTASTMGKVYRVESQAVSVINVLQ